jgi:hypothetical protein
MHQENATLAVDYALGAALSTGVGTASGDGLFHAQIWLSFCNQITASCTASKER